MNTNIKQSGVYSITGPNRRLTRLANLWFAVPTVAILALMALAPHAFAGGTWKNVFPNPGLTNPRMKFNTGTRINGADLAGLSRYLPAMPGPLSGKNGTVIIENIAPPGGCPLPFRAQRGSLRHLHYDLTVSLRQALSHAPIYRKPDGAMHRFVYTHQAKNLKDWTINSMYVGLETENRDFRHGARNHRPQGTVSVALQVANLRVMTEARQASHHAK